MTTIAEQLDGATRARLETFARLRRPSSPMRRDVVRLVWHGLSAPQIAERLGLPLSRVRALLEGGPL